MKTSRLPYIMLSAVIILLLISGCAGSTGYDRYPWTAQECHNAGGLLWCNGNWGYCECVSREAAERAMQQLP